MLTLRGKQLAALRRRATRACGRLPDPDSAAVVRAAESAAALVRSACEALR